MIEKPILEIRNLRVQIQGAAGVVQPVDQINLTIARGEIMALVGESGCGKTMTALAINRLLPPGAWYCEGSEIILADIPIHQISLAQMRQVRKNKISMIFQDPSAALNPVLNIQEQLYEIVKTDPNLRGKKQINQRILELLENVRIPSPEILMNQYPHQLSGGLKQRVMIAMAIASKPDLLIADEPTTALDVTTQAQVLNLLRDLNQQYQMAILLITHDLGIVAQMAQSIAVMYAGVIVEQGSVDAFIASPKHPYSQKLFDALPENATANGLATIPGHVPPLNKHFTLCRFKERCPYVFKACEIVYPELYPVNANQAARCHWHNPQATNHIPNFSLSALKQTPDVSTKPEIEPIEQGDLLLSVQSLQVHFPIKQGLFKRTVGYIKAVDGVNLAIHEGETLAIVGESGCGKTTIGKAIIRLIETTSGQVEFMHQDFLALSWGKLREMRREIQIIFQDPFSSMDPRMLCEEIIEEGMIELNIGSNEAERKERVDILLEQVGLPRDFKNRYPHELSGGQRQRLAIARAIAVGARLIICDEPTSALDVSVQAQILNLLKNLQNELGISYIFITHNINVVEYLAHEIAVMYLGKVVEYGPKEEVFNHPKHPYTQALFASQPSLTKQTDFFKAPKGEVPSIVNPPRGCHFSTRCPYVHARCYEAYPPFYDVGPAHQATCYLYDEKSVEKKIKIHVLSSNT